ncbi:MAG: SusD/RagB family nutrient-binding outer membrane lipoprotein [Saprospiraceae bacterium]
MKSNILRVSFSLVCLMMAVSCSKDSLDINKDPNRGVESNMTASVILPQALFNAATRVGTGYGFLGHWLGYWCPPANYSPSGEEQSYNISTNFGAGLFSGIMDNAYDFEFAEIRAKAANENYYIGISKIMKAFSFTTLVEIYNNIPYSEALKGLEYIRPKYDDGKLVYEQSLIQIDSSITYFKAAKNKGEINDDIKFRDIMFKGDADAWVRFANSLKLRLLLHQSAKSDRAAYITAELSKITAEGSGFLKSGEDASVSPGFSQDKSNPYYGAYGFTATGTQATDFWRANRFAMELLKLSSDPRLGAFYKKVTNAFPSGGSEPFVQNSPLDYRGNEYGRPIDNSTYPSQTANFVSQIGGIPTAAAVSPGAIGLIKGYDQRLWVMTSVEAAFLQAEAIERGWLPGNKETAYKNAVQESFRWLNIEGSKTAADAAFTKWYTTQDENNNKAVSYQDADNKLQLVLGQKYLAMNGTNHLEAWTDYRRNNAYPAIPLSINPGRTSTNIPVRLLYPQREYDLNTASVQAQGAVNQFTSKIWWMN